MASTAASYRTNVAQARTLVHKGNLHLSTGSHVLAFPLYLQAAELYSLVVRQAPDPLEKRTVKTEWAEALRLAGLVKRVLKGKVGEGGVRVDLAELRCSQNAQTRVLLMSSSVSTPSGGLSFPMWKDPSPSEFTDPPFRPDPNAPVVPEYLDASYPPLSPLPPGTSIWKPDLRPESIEQDAVRDCSLVAGIQAVLAWELSTGRKDLLVDVLHPQSEQQLPIASANGAHFARLFFNGAWRRVALDANLPIASLTGKPVGIRISGATAAEALGLGLLEKSWLKVMGGWDFPGSNSSVDLNALTGWIPETIPMRVGDFQREKTWTRLRDSFRKGRCLITIGTGKLSEQDIALTGLIPSHDYAVQDLVESGLDRELVLINPWRRKQLEDAQQEKHEEHPDDNTSVLSSIIDSTRWTDELRASLNGVGKDGTFRLPWETVCAVFNTVYVNWDPSMFPHVASVHSQWSESSTSKPSRLDNQPQFTLQTSSTVEVWLLLSRHLSRTGAQASSESNRRRDFMSLQVFEEGAARAAKPFFGSEISMTFSDSPHILVRITPSIPRSTFTVVVPRDGSEDEARFSLFAYATSAVQIEDVSGDLPYQINTEGEFTGRSAGGSVGHPTFMANPMYRLEVKKAPAPPSRNGLAGGGGEGDGSPRTTGEVRLALTTPEQSLPVNVKVVWGGAKRITNLVQGDVLADSGLYSPSFALCKDKAIAPGVYTVVLSTFAPRQEGVFALAVQSTLPIELTPIPQEGAGMFARTIRGDWTAETAAGAPGSGRYEFNPTFRLTLSRPTEILIRLQLAPPSSSSPFRPTPINLSLFRRPASSPAPGDPLPPWTTDPIATSGAYSDALSGVLVAGASSDEVQPLGLEPGEYYAVCSTYTPGWVGAFALVSYARPRPVEWERVV